MASIPGACNVWAETQAAYWFRSGDEFDWMDILEPHRQCTRGRIAQHPLVLCRKAHHGAALQRSGHCGARSLDLRGAARDVPAPDLRLDAGPRAAGGAGRLDVGTRPGIKESVCRGEGYARVAELAGELPETRLVYVADRESDIRELMVRARDLGTPADWLLRSQHNRALPEGGRLWAKVLASPSLGEIRFTLPAGRGRMAREVRQALYAQRVSLSDGRRGTFEVTCLVAREIGAPPGVKPIEWRLLTNRSAETLEAVVELIDWYRARWEIELLFLVLKEGCRVEALQLGTVERIERALALFLVVAWRIARLMRLGRTLPDLDAALLLEPEEWQAA